MDTQQYALAGQIIVDTLSWLGAYSLAALTGVWDTLSWLGAYSLAVLTGVWDTLSWLNDGHHLA